MPPEYAIAVAAGLCLFVVLGGGLYKRLLEDRWRKKKEEMEKSGPDWLELDDDPAEPAKEKDKVATAGKFSLGVQGAMALLFPVALFFMIRNVQTETSWDSNWWAILVLALLIGATAIFYLKKRLLNNQPLAPGAPATPNWVARARYAGLKTLIIVLAIFFVVYAIDQVSHQYSWVRKALNESRIRDLAVSSTETWWIDALALVFLFAWKYARTVDIRVPRYVSGDTSSGYVTPAPAFRGNGRRINGGDLAWIIALLLLGAIIYSWFIGGGLLFSNYWLPWFGVEVPTKHSEVSPAPAPGQRVNIRLYRPNQAKLAQLEQEHPGLKEYLEKNGLKLSQTAIDFPPYEGEINWVDWPSDIARGSRIAVLALSGSALIGCTTRPERLKVAEEGFLWGFVEPCANGRIAVRPGKYVVQLYFLSPS